MRFCLRNVIRLYPYDISEDDGDGVEEKSLRGSSQEIADILKEEIQKKVEIAGLEISEARITHLAYAPEIAAAMLQRQQASAIIDARKLIVEGAVGMVEMALNKLGENDIVALDEERKAAMVSNLLVVLCGNKDAQPSSTAVRFTNPEPAKWRNRTKRKKQKNSCCCGFLPRCGRSWHPGRRMTSARLTVRLSIC